MTEKKLSRQRRWQLAQRAAGMCERCGKPICIESRRYCHKHLVVYRKLKAEDRKRKKMAAGT